jgi:DNA polymerase-3 subunit gamma/tau
MLSASSFNALLKTLEEPPPRVVFILATTEPHKILATIQSRCQRHDFRLLGRAEIGDHLRKIAAAEGVTPDERAITVLAQAAAGSLRDAQSLLDQAIACLGDQLTGEAVADLLGLVRADLLADAAEAILLRDPARALRLVDALARHGQDLRQFTLELCSHLRDLAILKLCPEPGTLLEGARVDAGTGRAQAERVSLPELELMIKGLQQAEGEMRRAPQPRLILELALIRLTEVRSLSGVQNILDQLASLESRLAAGQPVSTQPAVLPLFDRPAAAPPRPAPAPATVPTPQPAATSSVQDRADIAPAADVAAGWEGTVARLKGRKRLASVLAEVRPIGLEGDRLLLEVPNGNAFLRDTLEDQETRRLLGETASAAFGNRLRVEYRFVAAVHPPPPDHGVSEDAGGSRPQDHPLVREALNLFGGTVIR